MPDGEFVWVVPLQQPGGRPLRYGRQRYGHVRCRQRHGRRQRAGRAGLRRVDRRPGHHVVHQRPQHGAGRVRAARQRHSASHRAGPGCQAGDGHERSAPADEPRPG